MIILLTNDDGINAAGIRSLYEALSTIGKVYVVAPDRNRSAAAHSLTLHKPLRLEQIQGDWYAVSGTPTDCVNLAVNVIRKESNPDILVSGINQGGNLADAITYSGTVSAAIEGTLLDITSMAISVDGRNEIDYSGAAQFAMKMVRTIIKNGMPEDALLNVNVPDLPLTDIKGVKITRQGKSIWEDSVVEKVDPRGQKYYWIGGNNLGWEEGEDTDIQAVRDGYISVTPLHLDFTNYCAVKELQHWRIDLQGL